MSIISFIDDNVVLGRATLHRDFSKLEQIIQSQYSEYTYSFREEESIYAIDISKNNSLSNIYEMDCYVVRFVLLNVDTLHKDNQEKNFLKLFYAIKKITKEKKGYYNLRIPTHFVDIIKAYNETFSDSIFCGGTVEWVGKNDKCEVIKKEDVQVFWATEDYILKNKERLIAISSESFKVYQGQYHISSVTSLKAGMVYEKWLANSIENYKGNVAVVEMNGVPIAFLLCYETEESMENVLSAVDTKYREYGAYKTMITFIMNAAYENDKFFVTSTQFDNFIVQGVWAGLGLKPFYSIYNVHIDANH